jgi:Opacity protein and related surface antigens
MRRIVKLGFLFVVLVVSMNSYGQTSKGNYIVSGSTGLQFLSSNTKNVYDGETQNEFDTKTFSFNPSAGYFIVDNLAIGLSFNITSNKSELDDNNYNKSTSTLIAPTAMYYFPVDGKIRPFAQLGLGLQSVTNKVKMSYSENKQTLNGFAVNVGGGVSYFVSNHVAVELCLSYTKSNLKDTDNEKLKLKQGTFGSNIGISLFF